MRPQRRRGWPGAGDAEADDDAPRQAGEEQHVEAGRGDQHRGAEVGLPRDQRTGTEQQQRGDDVVRACAAWLRILSKYQASISGTAIFISSEGWMRVTPMLSQRRAPLTMSPKSATATSSSDPEHVGGHGEAHQRLRRHVGDDPHRAERDRDVAELAGDARRVSRSCAENSVTRPTAISARTSAEQRPSMRWRGGRQGDAARVARAPSVALVVLVGFRAGRRQCLPAACRAGSSRSPCARSARRRARRSRRSRPAPRARSSGCRPARRR